MPLYYFDVHDGRRTHFDKEGHVFETIERVRTEAQRLLPEIAYHEVPESGDHRSFVTIVRDETGKAIFSATLNYHGLWLDNPDG